MSDTIEDAMAETVPLDSPARHGLSDDQEKHLRHVTASQSALMEIKYRRGQREHGGDCWKKPGMLAHAQEEVADLAVYLFTLDEQMRALANRLREGFITKDEAADEIERWLVK